MRESCVHWLPCERKWGKKGTLVCASPESRGVPTLPAGAPWEVRPMSLRAGAKAGRAHPFSSQNSVRDGGGVGAQVPCAPRPEQAGLPPRAGLSLGGTCRWAGDG